MLKIIIPNNNIAERKYIIDIIFSEFLGLDYLLELGSNNYKIILENEKILEIEDKFFNKYPKDLEYLRYENIPKNIKDLDMFSASFFMLTRWEEYVNIKRDKHGRFPATESLAYKQGFLNRPIVNEYLEDFKIKLLEKDGRLKFKKRKFNFVLTHDVDLHLKFPTFFLSIKHIFKILFKKRNIVLAIKDLLVAFKTFIKVQKDPYDTYDYLMDLSEKYGTKSYFFFMGEGLTKFDSVYKNSEKFIQSLVKKIKTRKHHIGIHPSYNSFKNEKKFRKEKQDLEKNFNCELKFGRQHFLRIAIPDTWQIWEDNNMDWDSSCGYPEKEGFRCGTCYEFSVFNILSRKKLNLKEKPLIFMDGTFANYQVSLKPDLIQKKIEEFIYIVKKYDGEFVLLWHNSSLNDDFWIPYQNIYEYVLKK